MRNESFTVKYISVKNCFLHFSERWLENFKDLRAMVPVLKLEYGSNKFGYFSCSPVSLNSDDNYTVGISATYAQKLGLKDKENVILSLCSNISSVSRINVSPMTADDWEILEMSSNVVQSSLLDQVRVVWSNQILVVWISRSLYLKLRVDGLDSDCVVGILEPFSDVVVAPAAAEDNPVTMSKQEEKSNEVTSTKTNLVSEVPQDHNDQTENLKSNQTLITNLWATLKRYMLVRSDKIVSESVEGPVRTEVERQSIAALENYKPKFIPMLCRIHPINFTFSRSEERNGDRLFLQPYNVFVRKCCLTTWDSALWNNRSGVVICKLNKIPYPVDSTSKHTSKDDKHKRQNNSSMSSSHVLRTNVYVQLFVIEDIYETLSESLRAYLNKVTVSEKNGHNSILMSDVARSVLGTKIGSRVSLEVVNPPLRSSISGIQITPLEKWEKETKKLEVLCRSYVADEVKTHCLLINSEAVLPIKNGLLSSNVLVSLVPGEVEYAVLDPECMRRCKLTVKENTSELNFLILMEDSVNDSCFFHIGSEMKKLLFDGLTTLELSLNLLPLTTKLFPSRTHLSSDNILILGSAGSGKSTFARNICIELKQAPHFVHSVEVQCRYLKGKKVETLQKMMTEWLQECIYYQPSLLVLDDLDAIAGTGGLSPGDEASAENNYNTRVSERLSELLEEFQLGNCISVIATAPSVLKVNPALAAPRGQHIFKTVLEIPELKKVDRKKILQNIIDRRSDVTVDGTVSINWEKFAAKSEGYVVQDLVDLVEKTIFHSLKTTVSAHIQEEDLEDLSCISLKNEDFEEALKNTVPLLQRGVELYQGGSHSWDDIGGLSGVKKVLIEILQWPSQYPELFENAPLRHQSGLLLYGAPGTGKTLLAGAVAHECGLKFISIKGPELLSKYIGASEEGVRNIFQKAQSVKPCVLFFDEFDSLAPRRGHDSTGVTDRVVNQLLTQLDGVESLCGVWVMAATSRPDLIDPALLRPGRLDTAINCPLPDRDDRLSILQALSKKMVLSEDIDFKEIADNTKGFTGADLQAVLYTAQLMAMEKIIAQHESEEQGTVGDDGKHQAANHLSRNKFEGTTNGPMITQTNLQAALKDTRPSLTEGEKLKYRLIYEKFEKSRGGTSAEDMASMPQRATLA